MKFKNLDAYQQEGYELLPFNFDAFDANRYILTNLVGEYILIERSVLVDLIDEKLNYSHPVYAELLSKHFIKEKGLTSAVSLLALKYRTKFSRLPNFTSLHIFVATLRCDHSCPYCQVSRQCSNAVSEFDMTIETASKAIDFMFRTPSPAIKIEFQGGEPLLNFDLVKYVVVEAKHRNQTHHKNLDFVIATTLSLLDDDVLNFCKDHDIHLSSSLDGPKELHNNNRPRPNRDSYERFIAGLTKARNVLGFDKVSALMTTTEESLKDVSAIIDEYVRLGFEGIFLRALSPYGHAIKRKRYDRYDASKWLDFYKSGLDYIIQLNKLGIPFIEHYATIVLQKMLTNNDPGYVDLMNPSGAGIAAIVFNYDGDIYASDESRMLAEMGDKHFRIGNIHDNDYKEVMLNDTLLNTLEDSFTLSAPMCSDCAFESYCGAEPVYHYAMFGDVLGKKYESDFCYKNMEIFKHLISLMESDPEVKTLFMRWVNRC